MERPFEERFMLAVRQLGRTEAERASRLGYSVRIFDYWEKGQGLAATLKKLESLGIIRIVDAEEQPTKIAA